MALTESSQSAEQSPQVLLVELYHTHARRLFLQLALAWYRKQIVPSHFFQEDFHERIRDWVLEVSGGTPESSVAVEDPIGPQGDRIHLQEVLPQLLILMDGEIEDLEEQLEAKGVTPLKNLAETFELSDFEQSLVIFALSSMIDPRISGICSAIRGRPSLKSPTLQIALEIQAPTPEERCEAIATLFDDSPLFTEHIMQLGNGSTLTEREFMLDDGVVRFLMAPLNSRKARDTGNETQLVTIRAGKGTIASLGFEYSFVRELVEILDPGSPPRILSLTGRQGDGVEMLAEAICAEIGDPICLINLSAGEDIDTDDFYKALLKKVTEARLRGAIPVVRCERLKGEEGGAEAARLQRQDATQLILGRWPTSLAIFLSEAPPKLSARRLSRPIIQLQIPPLNNALRRGLWRDALSLPLKKGEEDDPIVRLSRLPMNREQILDISERAASQSEFAYSREIDPALLFDLSHMELSRLLTGFGKRIIPTETWDTLILQEQTEAQLRELLARAKHQEMIFEKWGMKKRFRRGGGLTALFSGPPGTGKTTAAEIIANDLGVVLYRIDMSKMLSKYVGETERNMGMIFDQASESGALLLFDEADSLFAKRTEVKTSMDRYSNQMVNYLLERLENYAGVALLTTNLPKSIDAAFQRRIALHVHFPEPSADERIVLWKHFFPEETPVDTDIDWEEISELFELTGGHIKNAALRAAVLAAQAGDIIREEHIFEAASREYRAMGHLVIDHESRPQTRNPRNNRRR